MQAASRGLAVEAGCQIAEDFGRNFEVLQRSPNYQVQSRTLVPLHQLKECVLQWPVGLVLGLDAPEGLVMRPNVPWIVLSTENLSPVFWIWTAPAMFPVGLPEVLWALSHSADYHPSLMLP